MFRSRMSLQESESLAVKLKTDLVELHEKITDFCTKKYNGHAEAERLVQLAYILNCLRFSQATLLGESTEEVLSDLKAVESFSNKLNTFKR